jgi:hypothetical protein
VGAHDVNPVRTDGRKTVLPEGLIERGRLLYRTGD